MDSINSVYLCKVLKYPIFMTMKRYSLLLTLLFLPFMLMMGQTSGGSMSSEPIQRSFFKVFTLGDVITESEINEFAGVSGDGFFDYTRLMTDKMNEDVLNHRVIGERYFGGYKWDYVDIILFKHKFCLISFYNSSEDTYNFSNFESLKEILTYKYGKPYLSDDISSSSEHIALWRDDSTLLILSYQYSECMNGNMAYFLRLTYVDSNLYEQVENSKIDEL